MGPADAPGWAVLPASGFGPFAAFARCLGMPSTVVRRFEYDPRSEALDVEFVSGRRYRYRRVPEEVAQAFRAAFSKGRFFNARIRDRYRCEELAPEPAGDLWEL
jgi:lysyl-tRNA synthetase class 2